MDYYMTQSYQAFFITAKNIQKVMKAISILGGRRYSWVDPNFPSCETLKDMFAAWRWDIGFDEDGNVDDIQFNGEKLGDDKILFDAIAPFVDEDSYIEMSGEESAEWRWYFKNKKCYELEGVIAFEDIPEE